MKGMLHFVTTSGNWIYVNLSKVSTISVQHVNETEKSVYIEAGSGPDRFTVTNQWALNIHAALVDWKG